MLTGFYFLGPKTSEKPHSVVTGLISPTVSPSTHLMGLLKSPLARHWQHLLAYSVWKRASDKLWKHEKTQLTTQQIHPSSCVFTRDCDTYSTADTKTSFGNLHRCYCTVSEMTPRFWRRPGNEPKEPNEMLRISVGRFVSMHACVCATCVSFLTPVCLIWQRVKFNNHLDVNGRELIAMWK